MPLLPSPTLSLEDQQLALRSASGARVLSELAVLSITGKDRVSWLNGIVTHDIKKLSAGESTYAAAVHVKGRILSDLFVYVRPEELLLSAPCARVAELSAHLERFIVMEDVSALPTELSVLSVQGPSADFDTRGLPERYPAQRLGSAGFDLLVTSQHPGFELTSVSLEAWEHCRINAFIPAFDLDFDATNFVQEAAITPRAVSFHKGCYVGQEMVCRLEMRGHVQKLLVGLSFEGAARRGDRVLSGETQVGSITSAAPSALREGFTQAIAMVKYGPVDQRAALHVNGALATIRPLS